MFILGGGRGRPEGRVATKDWSAFDKFDYRTVKDGGGRCWSGFTSDSRKELIGRSPVMAYELGTKPRAYRGSAVNGEGAAGCSIRVPCHTHSSSHREVLHFKWLSARPSAVLVRRVGLWLAMATASATLWEQLRNKKRG